MAIRDWEDNCHSGAPQSGEPGIDIPQQGLWIPGPRTSLASRNDGEWKGRSRLTQTSP